jgi:hypothetical protein
MRGIAIAVLCAALAGCISDIAVDERIVRY